MPDAPLLWSQLQARGWLEARYVGFEVHHLDTLLAKAKTAGARVISGGGGPVELKDGQRAVLLRDPDVGGCVELLESP